MKHKLFNLFLVVYLVFLVHHAVHEISWIMLAGLFVAVWSHTYRTWSAPGLLVVHMTIEWVEWVHNPVSLVGWIVRLFHAGMDMTFFDHEVSAHRRSSWWLWGAAIFLLIFVSSSFFIEIPEAILEILHQFSLGGAVGCVGSHLYFHIRHERK